MFANLKNADCKIVFVRLPIPISIALSMALIVYNWILLSAIYFLDSAGMCLSNSSSDHWQLIMNTPPGLTS